MFQLEKKKKKNKTAEAELNKMEINNLPRYKIKNTGYKNAQ